MAMHAPMPPLRFFHRYLFSTCPDRSVCSCVCTRIITTSRASTFLLSPPPPPFFRARFRFTRNFEIYERPLIVTLLFLRSLHRPVSIIAPIFQLFNRPCVFLLHFICGYRIVVCSTENRSRNRSNEISFFFFSHYWCN